MRLPELKAMLRLGLVDETVSELGAFLMWGRLLDDPVLWQARLDLDPEATIVPPLLDVLKRLTAAEAVALRQRLDASKA